MCQGQDAGSDQNGSTKSVRCPTLCTATSECRLHTKTSGPDLAGTADSGGRAGLLDMSLGKCATATQKDNAHPPWSDTLASEVVYTTPGTGSTNRSGIRSAWLPSTLCRALPVSTCSNQFSNRSYLAKAPILSLAWKPFHIVAHIM